MAGALVFDFDSVFGFVRERVPGLALAEGMTAIGWDRSGALVAGAVFEGYNGRNIWVHLAGDGGGWMSRQFLRACMAYVFTVCGCARLSAFVAESNATCRRFTEHFGFALEARLRGAAKDGGDFLIYVLTKEECRHAIE